MSQRKTSIENLGVLYTHPLFTEHREAWHPYFDNIKSSIISRADSVVYHGDGASALYVIQSGWVKLIRQTPDGKETIIGLCSKNDLFGEAALFHHANYPYSAEILSDNAELIVIPSDVLRKAIESDANLSNKVMSLLNERTYQAQLKLEQMSTMSAAQRLGCFILHLCGDNNDNGAAKIQIPVGKNILATYLGMKPETLSRSQQQLKSIGIQTNASEVIVSDVEKLKNFVCESCSASGSCDVEEY